jgi:hypothetical protein
MSDIIIDFFLFISFGFFFFFCSSSRLNGCTYKKIIPSIVKKYNIFFFFVHYFFMVAQIFKHTNRWKKMKKKFIRGREKKSILLFQSHNNIRSSNSCVVDHHITWSASSIELHEWMYVFRLIFSYSVCLTGFFLLVSRLFFYYIRMLEEKRPCLLSFTYSFTHSFDLSRNNIQRTRREEQHPNVRLKCGY